MEQREYGYFAPILQPHSDQDDLDGDCTQKQKVVPSKAGNGDVAGDSQKKQKRSRKDTRSSLLEAEHNEFINRGGNAWAH